MKNTLYCFTLGFKNAFAVSASYRADYFMSLIILILSDLIIPMVTLLIYHNGAGFPGWNLYDVLLIQGMFLIIQGIANPLFDGLVSTTLYLVRNGEYDMILLKPRSPILTAIIMSFNMDGFGKLFTGTAMSVFAMIKNGYTPSYADSFKFLFLICLALVILFTFDLIIAATSFVWVGNSRLFEIVYSVIRFGQYPATIYPKILKNIVSYVIPVAVMGFYPAAMLAGRFDGNLLMLALGTLGFFFAGLAVWKIMLPRYMSAGG